MIVQGYNEILHEQMKDLKKIHKPVVLFGTMAAGLIAKRILDDLNITVSCFCDNNVLKQGKRIHGLIVLSPEQVKEKYPEAKIYICSFNHSSMVEMNQQLKKLGFEDIHNNDIFLYYFNRNLINRNISEEDYVKIFNKKQSGHDLIINNVALFITERCSLKCVNCNIFIPYYLNPKHYSKDMIIESIKTFAQSVDFINNVGIQGGEPFTHPELAEICEEISKIKNINAISIVTNGTIVPDTDTLKRISRCIHYIAISDYGKYSQNIRTLCEELEKHEMIYEIFDEKSQWIEFKIPEKQNRSNQENDELFSKCELLHKSCSFIIGGQYHLCQISAAAAPFEIVSNNNNDYVTLTNSLFNSDELKMKINMLIHKKKSLAVCDYCEVHKKITVIRAEQMY